jgi:hypothetical protein
MFVTILVSIPSGTYRLGLFGRRVEAERFARAMLPSDSSWEIVGS